MRPGYQAQNQWQSAKPPATATWPEGQATAVPTTRATERSGDGGETSSLVLGREDSGAVVAGAADGAAAAEYRRHAPLIPSVNYFFFEGKNQKKKKKTK